MNTTTAIVILGGRGMLGTDLAKACKQKGLNTLVLDLPEFDITDPAQLKQAIADKDIIINCAAYTNVEKAESETQLAHKINAEAVGWLGQFAKQADSYLLHISTDFVFDGKLDRPYTETDPPNPINAYGRTKLIGEQLLTQSGCRHCILRVQWTYGSAGDNFVTKIIKHAKQADTMKVIDDQTGSPTATTEVADAICELLPNRPQGIFHFAADGYCSRFEMAKFIFDKLNIAADLTNCKTSDYTTAAERPLNSRFNCNKIQSLLAEPIKNWQGPLTRFLEQLKL